MTKEKDRTEKILKKLLSYNTPTISNVVATYPNNPYCLGLGMGNGILTKK